MGLTLKIDNETSLPDGGPLSVTVSGKRGIDIGRDQHLDWTLPDPTRYISGKHCEIRYRDGGYWLYDVSTNGTYLNGSEQRLPAPHRLRDGDHLTIGHYIVTVAIDGEEAAVAPQRMAVQPTSYQELWKPTDDAAPPVDARHLRAPAERPAPVRPDFLDWSIDVPDPTAGDPMTDAPRNPPPPSDDDLSWASGAPKPVPIPAPAPSVPTPRRPAGLPADAEEPWGLSPFPAPKSDSPAARERIEPPPAAPAASAAPPVPLPAGTTGDLADFIRRLAAGANVPEQVLAQRDPGELATQIGGLVRTIVENTKQLLDARVEAKRLARSASHTTIQALDNNPLKFSPTADDALRIMFGPRTRSYLDAQQALEQSFSDLKAHQVRTYSAMQQALRMLAADIDPQAIDKDTAADRGIGAVIASRKAKLWDAYVTRWNAKTRGFDGGLVDAFMVYFAECYDKGQASDEASPASRKENAPKT
jgi:type VI secretion system protein ImpI